MIWKNLLMRWGQCTHLLLSKSHKLFSLNLSAWLNGMNDLSCASLSDWTRTNLTFCTKLGTAFHWSCVTMAIAKVLLKSFLSLFSAKQVHWCIPYHWECPVSILHLTICISCFGTLLLEHNTTYHLISGVAIQRRDRTWFYFFNGADLLQLLAYFSIWLRQSNAVSDPYGDIGTGAFMLSYLMHCERQDWISTCHWYLVLRNNCLHGYEMLFCAEPRFSGRAGGHISATKLGACQPWAESRRQHANRP